MENKIQAIIVKLHLDKKPVSVGMVKAKLSSNVPLPSITGEISSYKKAPEAYVASHNHLLNRPIERVTHESANSDSQEKANLEQRVEQLEEQVKLLQLQLNELINK